MRLHTYTHYSPFYTGHGFGSMFARIFSKIGAKVGTKVAARVALKVAKRAGTSLIKKAAPMAKRVIRKQIVPLGKKLAKQGLEKGLEYGQEVVLNKLNHLDNSAIKAGVPPALAHKVTDLVKRGSIAGLHELGAVADRKTTQFLDQSLKTKSSRKRPSSRRPRVGGLKKRKKHSLQTLIDLA